MGPHREGQAGRHTHHHRHHGGPGAAGRGAEAQHRRHQQAAELKGSGYNGDYTRLADFIRAWCEQAGQTAAAKADIPLAFELGEAYKFDGSEQGLVMSGIQHRAQVAHMKLCASRAFGLVVIPSHGNKMHLRCANPVVRGAPLRTRAVRCGRKARARSTTRGAQVEAHRRLHTTTGGASTFSPSGTIFMTTKHTHAALVAAALATAVRQHPRGLAPRHGSCGAVLGDGPMRRDAAIHQRQDRAGLRPFQAPQWASGAGPTAGLSFSRPRSPESLRTAVPGHPHTGGPPPACPPAAHARYPQAPRGPAPPHS